MEQQSGSEKRVIYCIFMEWSRLGVLYQNDKLLRAHIHGETVPCTLASEASYPSTHTLPLFFVVFSRPPGELPYLRAEVTLVGELMFSLVNFPGRVSLPTWVNYIKLFTCFQNRVITFSRVEGYPTRVKKRSAHASLPCFRREFAIEIIRDAKTN